MCVVYFENNFITFTSDPANTGSFVVEHKGLLDVTKVLQKLGNNNSVAIKSADPKGSYQEFTRFFRAVPAAGGVVGNGRGEILMIRRRGVWDLPKGWIEPGETPSEAALREVEEECGIGNLVLGEFLTATEHIYPLGKEWILKQTSWYSMTVCGTPEPTPQTEEEITEVRWVAKQEVESLTKDSFPTVKQVLKNV